MSRHARPFIIIYLLILVACSPASQATPVLIGAYPSSAAPYATVPPRLLVNYESYLELTVSEVAQAEARAQQLANDYGGYLASSQVWYQNDQRYATLTLAVPVAQFDSFYSALRQTGQPERETTTGSPVSTAGGANPWNTYAHLTLNLRPAPPAFTLPSLPNVGWDPANTFASAFKVFAAIFTFLLDIVIWLLVVFGPFALLGWGAYLLVKRVRAKAGNSK